MDETIICIPKVGRNINKKLIYDTFERCDFGKIKRIDLIKFDIEGFEKSAIEGLRLYLENLRPIIMLEISEVGKEQFGDFSSFTKTFPMDYRFYFCQWQSNLINRMMVFSENQIDYRDFSGNVFCIPSEKNNLFTDVAGI